MPVSRTHSIVMIGVVTLTASVAGWATPQRDSPAQGATAAPQAPAAPAAGGRQGGGPPTRDPLTPGYVKATELPDGQVPPVNANGNFIIGPTHPASPDSVEKEGVAKGTIHTFTMESADSKIYPGIVRQPGARQEDPANPAKLNVPSGPGPYTRRVAVYIPAGYTPGAISPLIVGADGPDQLLFTALDNLIAQKKIPPMVAVSIGNGGSDAQGSQRGLEYDTMSGLYAEFVETEVLPSVEQRFGVRLTKDPNSRATMGCSSGASAALSMAWYRNDLYRRVLSYSGTYVNQQWPWNPETPGRRVGVPPHADSQLAEEADPPLDARERSRQPQRQPHGQHARLGDRQPEHGEGAGRQSLRLPVHLQPQRRPLRPRRQAADPAAGARMALAGPPAQRHALTLRERARAMRALCVWRRGRDSNPRADYSARRFRGAPVTTTSVPLRLSLASLQRSTSRAIREECLDHAAAFFFQHPRRDVEAVIERRVLVRAHRRLDRARLRLRRAVNQARDPRVDHRPHAHLARLDGHVERRARQPVVPDAAAPPPASPRSRRAPWDRANRSAG